MTDLLLRAAMALSAAAGPTGRETAAVETAAQFLAPLVDTTWVDKLGNLIGLRRCGRPNAPRVVLDAHLDEVCLIVTGQEENYLTFQPAFGSIDPRVLPGTVVELLADPPRRGVVTCLPPHILSAEEQEKAFDLDRLRIDLGGETVPVGTPAVFTTEPVRLGEYQLCGKALDDRSCFAVLLRTLELTDALPFDLYVLGSVQEESTMAGAKAGLFSILPQAVLVVDVTFGTSPDTSTEDAFVLGEGPAIGVGPLLSKTLTAQLRACAVQCNLPHKLEIMERSLGTNAMAAGITGEGIPAAMVSLPLRYMHTPCEVIDLRDAENTAQLIAAWLRALRPEDLQ